MSQCGALATAELSGGAQRVSRMASCDSLDHTFGAREDGRMKKLALIFLFGCAACTTQAQDPTSNPSADKTPAAAAAAPASLSDIRRLIGTPTCSDNSQCRTIPVGARACGGPQEYLPWSTLRSNEGELRKSAERFKAERQAAIKSSGEMSTCIHQPDPGAVCVAGTCQLGGSSPAA